MRASEGAQKRGQTWTCRASSFRISPSVRVCAGRPLSVVFRAIVLRESRTRHSKYDRRSASVKEGSTPSIATPRMRYGAMPSVRAMRSMSDGGTAGEMFRTSRNVSGASTFPSERFAWCTCMREWSEGGGTTHNETRGGESG